MPVVFLFVTLIIVILAYPKEIGEYGFRISLMLVVLLYLDILLDEKIKKLKEK